jgi:flagellar export protein FliJ
MAKVQYPLQQVLDVKLKRVEDAEKVVKEKQQILNQEQEKLKRCIEERDKMRQHYDAKIKQLRDELDHATTSPKVQQMKSYLNVVKEKLKVEDKKVADQQAKVDTATKDLEEARRQLQIKRQEVDKLEMHRADWKKTMRKEEELKEEREYDEIGNIIYGIHSRKNNRE